MPDLTILNIDLHRRGLDTNRNYQKNKMVTGVQYVLFRFKMFYQNHAHIEVA